MEHEPGGLILISTDEDEEERREGDEECCWRSVEDEYKILADLTGFDNLRAMLETERVYMRSKKRKRKRKSSGVGYGTPQENVTVVDAKEEEAGGELFEPESNMVSDNIDVSRNYTVDAERVKEQMDGVESVETATTFKGNGVVKSSIVIDLCSSSTEEDQVEVNVSCCRAAEELMPADSVVPKRRRRRRRRQRTKKERMPKACEGIGSVLWEKMDKSVGTLTPPLGTQSVGIRENTVLRKLLRGPRYFDPPCSSSDECLKCGQVHLTTKCTTTNKKKPCCLCGGFRHSYKQCTQGLDCSVCKGRGHRAKHCPEKNQGDQPCPETCLRCGESGHSMLSCTTNYSPDDLKCYMCKNFGHLCCVDFQDPGPEHVSCYNCGQSGHLGSDCVKPCEKARVSTCSKCKEEGHSARRCSNKLKVHSLLTTQNPSKTKELNTNACVPALAANKCLTGITPIDALQLEERLGDSSALALETGFCNGSSSMPENLTEAQRKNKCEEGTAIITMA